MNNDLGKVACLHADAFKNYNWKSQRFSDLFNTEYEYCDCRICKNSIYTGQFRMVAIAGSNNSNSILNTKEQNMSKEKVSVSQSLKTRHAKEGKGLSLKEFARRLSNDGDKIAQDWFANKSGMANDSRSDKNKLRVGAEKTATRSAKKSKKAQKSSPKAEK